ncbi:MAG: exodeoxyribonuclease VII large subunit, partial [Spirochaetales bacterium]|nr:exodeoxyribonuclease VII large subunit [Spirochaetales bacterium]
MKVGSQYSVSEITTLIKRSLESEYSGVRIEGEISNFRPAASEHLYFTLKDADAMISAVMFRGRASRLSFQPEDGQLVVAGGNISVYAKRGNYQIICDSLTKAGVGEILVMLEERKKRLAAEGLFDDVYKKPLPLFPSKIAVVTSPTGAALQDIMRVTRRRNAGIDIVVLPALVQGDGAAEAIAKQIKTANQHRLGDVIVVGRGGGSLEDLLPFSEEVVVRAVAESELPIISAVGHEID